MVDVAVKMGSQMPSMRIVRVAVAVLAVAAAGARADDACRTFAGSFTAVPPQQCASPVRICTHGTLTGELAGATGGIVAPGTLNLATGSTIGTYSGALCGGDRS